VYGTPIGKPRLWGYQALVMGRKFIGAELKDSYYDVARRNMEAAVNQRKQGVLL
jgi:hypothetical protein